MIRRVGCCTWTFGEAALCDVAMRARRAGLDGVELFGDVERVDPVEAKAAFESEGLEVWSITPADADISHPDPAVRQPALSYYERLMDFAVALGGPLVSCHGLVSRTKPVSSQADEDALLVQSTKEVCGFAARRGLKVVFEILNRYETHQIRTIGEGIDLLSKVGANNLSLLPDAYHMNIEEADPAAALRNCGRAIGLYHAADSNRGAIGDGHTDFATQMRALDDAGYAGPIILETNAPGPDPFSPDKGEGFHDVVEAQLSRSVSALRAMGA